MQIQLDPNIPTQLTEEQRMDFKSFLDIALESLTASAGTEIFTLGNAMLGALALIVVVLSGLKIAFGGGLQPWEIVKVIIGIWIPWVMLQFYTTNIPGMVHDFPHMIVAGGNWLNLLLVATLFNKPLKLSSSVQRELMALFRQLATNQEAAIDSGDILDVLTLTTLFPRSNGTHGAL